MKINRYSGLIIGLIIFAALFFVAQTGLLQEPEGFLDYLANAAFLFTFTSLFIPALISSVLFPEGGAPDLYLVLGFSISQFLLIGYFIGKFFESKK